MQTHQNLVSCNSTTLALVRTISISVQTCARMIQLVSRSLAINENDEHLLYYLLQTDIIQFELLLLGIQDALKMSISSSSGSCSTPTCIIASILLKCAAGSTLR